MTLTHITTLDNSYDIDMTHCPFSRITQLGSSSRVSAEVEEQHQKQLDELTQRAQQEAQRCTEITEERDSAAEKVGLWWEVRGMVFWVGTGLEL